MNSRKKALSDKLLLQLLPYSCISYSICLFVNYNGILWGQKSLISLKHFGLFLLVLVQFFTEHPHFFYMGFDPTPLTPYEHAVSCSHLSHSSIHVTIMENNQWGFAAQFQRALLQVADSTTVQKKKNWCHFLTYWISLSSFFKPSFPLIL